MSYLPPVESFLNVPNYSNVVVKLELSNHGYNFDQNKGEITKLGDSYLPCLQNFWIYNSSNKGPRKKCKNDTNCCLLSTCYYDDGNKKPSVFDNVKSRKSETNSISPNLYNFNQIRKSISKSTNTYRETIKRNGRFSPKSRNILASKICRLKKKAYHESLKIKYAALTIEYDEISQLIIQLNRRQNMKPNMKKCEILKLCEEIHITKASERLDEFICDLLKLIDRGDYSNPIILKFNNESQRDQFYKDEPHSSRIDPESNCIQMDHDDKDFKFIMDDDQCWSFLDSSGSTSFTEDLLESM